MSSEGNEGEQRGTKRVRRACTNCRRKKTRCPGELPICSFCKRLNQDCQYAEPASGKVSKYGRLPNPPQEGPQYWELLARISQLEQKLESVSVNNEGQSFDLGSSPAVMDRSSFVGQLSSPSNTVSWTPDPFTESTQSPLLGLPGPGLFLSPSRIQTAVNDFFLHSHNQPYSFFHELNFRSRLAEGLLPEYLLLAVVASADRFSQDGNKGQVGHSCAQRSWELVSKQLDNDTRPDLNSVQTTTLLSIFDFVECRNRSAWRKIGIAARLAQDMELMLEPDLSLLYQDQEERRRTFWSIYLLDSLATCGRARPPMLRDYSCKLHLPSTETNFRDGQYELSSDLDQALNKGDDHGSQHNLAPFARVIVIVTILSRCAQYVLQGLNLRCERPPWDAGSDYAAINSSLLDFESRAESHRPLQEVLAEHCMVGDHLDRHSAEHLVFSYALYHLSQCLLNHHFLLRRRLANYAAKVPLTFSSHASDACRDHAHQLTHLMENARNLGCELRSSFLGYCALIAGTINALHQYSTNEQIRQESMLGLSMNTLFLQNHIHYWKNAQLMLDDLQKFGQDAQHFSSLIDPSCVKLDFSIADVERLYNLADYSVVSRREESAMHYSIPGQAMDSIPLPAYNGLDEWMISTPSESSLVIGRSAVFPSLT